MSTPPELVLKTYSPPLRARLISVRTLILQCANQNSAIGEIEESLKWGQLSFATRAPKSGTPLRLGGNDDQQTYSLYVPCSTSLIAEFQEIHPEMFSYHGTREIRLGLDKDLPKPELTLFITAALSYYVK